MTELDESGRRRRAHCAIDRLHAALLDHDMIAAFSVGEHS
jgi:hypothetical protein